MGDSKFLQIETHKAKGFNLFTFLFCQPEEKDDFNEVILQLESVFSVLFGDEALEQISHLKKAYKKFSHQELLVEYTRLFLGPFKVLAPPYSSIYFGAKQLLSDETMWVSKFYQKANLKFDKEIKDLPDNITVETEFVYYLIFNQITELSKGNVNKAEEFHSLQEEFLTKHFNKWVPKFCDQVVKQSDNEFYCQLAKCFKFFVENNKIIQFEK